MLRLTSQLCAFSALLITVYDRQPSVQHNNYTTASLKLCIDACHREFLMHVMLIVILSPKFLLISALKWDAI